MLRIDLNRFGGVLVLVLGLWTGMAQAQEFRYRYVSLDQAQLPSGFTVFFPAGINNSGRVYGTACDDFCTDPRLAFFNDGIVTVLQASGSVATVNAGGTAGGFALDPQTFTLNAALLRGNTVEPIPPQPGEVFAVAFALNDSGTALVLSFDGLSESYSLYRNGQTTLLDFGPTVTNPIFALGTTQGNRSIDNQGIIAGTTGDPFVDARAFRFDPRTGEATILDPLPTEPLSWGLAINSRADVLGYSFESRGLERIGVWDRSGTFTTYFVEGTSQFPTISNGLLFNDSNLIVITDVSSPNSEVGNSYLVPKPGVRLNLADLVANLPPGEDLSVISDMNDHGSMIGSSSLGSSFLLERVGGGSQ